MHSKVNSEGLLPECSVSVKETHSKDDSSWNMHCNGLWINRPWQTGQAACSQITEILEKCWTILGKVWVYSQVHLKLWLHVSDHTCWQHSYSNSWDYYSFTGMGKISHSNYEWASSGIPAVYEWSCQCLPEGNPSHCTIFSLSLAAWDLSDDRQTLAYICQKATMHAANAFKLNRLYFYSLSHWHYSLAVVQQ